MESDLAAARACGECTVCCKVLKIEQPDLRKAAGISCSFLRKGKGCTIYAERPNLCRIWHCGWRRFDWIDPLMRPDLCGILVRLVNDGIPPGHRPDLGIAFEVLRTQMALRGAGVVEAISTVIAENVAAFIVVPGPPGYAGTRIFLNDLLRKLVEQRDRDGALATLEGAYQAGLSMPKEWAG